MSENVDLREIAPKLRLVPVKADAESLQKVEQWLLRSAPNPAPDDERLLQGLMVGIHVDTATIREAVDGLVRRGLLDQVQIGKHVHLIRAKRPARVLEEEDPEKVFRVQVQIDLEAEKGLLYRLMIVVEVVFLGLLVREWLLGFPGL